MAFTSPFSVSSTPAFGATTSLFGASSASVFAQQSSPSVFGGSSTPAFGAASTPLFGGSSTPAFGGFGAASTPAFGAAATGPTTPSLFGASSAGVRAWLTTSADRHWTTIAMSSVLCHASQYVMYTALSAVPLSRN